MGVAQIRRCAVLSILKAFVQLRNIFEFHLFLFSYIGEYIYVHFKPKNRSVKYFPSLE